MRRRLIILSTQIGFFALLLGAWALASYTKAVSPDLLPPPTKVASALIALVGRQDVLVSLGPTLGSVFASVLIAVPVGLLLGFTIASNRYWRDVLRPILYFPLSIPKSIFLPLFILAFGIGQLEAIAFGIFSVVFYIIVISISAAEVVSRDHIRVAQSYGATFKQKLLYVYLPSVVPLILEGVRLSLIFGFTAILMAEMYASKGGFGRTIATWAETYSIDRLLAGVFLISAIAVILNELLRGVERYVDRWRT